MKRSEMVDRLELLLENRNDADMVLDLCEKSGMMPPPIKNEFFGGHVSNIYTLEWEPEESLITKEEAISLLNLPGNPAYKLEMIENLMSLEEDEEEAP